MTDRRYDRTLPEVLLSSARAAPEAAAVVSGGATLSYGELADRALRLARALQDRGVRRGDRVAVYMDNGPDTAVAIYGAALAGAAFMVVNPQTKDDKLRYVLDDSGAAAMVTDGRAARVVARVASGSATLRHVLVAGAHPTEPLGGLPGAEGLEDVLAGARPEPLPTGLMPLDLAALVYTSGSTGNPKGVMLSHANMVFAQGSLAQYLRLRSDDRILNVLPLAFDYGLYQLLMAVYMGATLVLEGSFSFPADVVRRIGDEGVTVLPGVPTIFATLLALHRTKPFTLPSVRRITNTAAHLPDDYVPPLRSMCPNALIYRMYGLTECKRVSYLEPELVLEKPGSVGTAIPGTEVYVLGDDGTRVPPGTPGVLHVRGPHVMMGYWNLPDETAHMLKPGPYPGERVLCTHDLFTIDADGFLSFVGRSDDIIKSRGEKVSPIEVENALHALDGVREAAVVGVPDELLGEAVRAYVVLHDGASLGELEVRRHCMARLESHMVPRDVVFVDDLPKTPTGKVRKKSLREIG